MADSESTEGEPPRPESKEAVQEETREADKGESDKKKAAVGGKVGVRLQAAGDAPIMKTRNYNVSGSFKVADESVNLSIAFRLIERNGLVGLSPS